MKRFLEFFLYLHISPGTKPHQCSFLLLYSIRKSDVAIHNFTRSRLPIKLYVHPVHCFSIKNLNENIKDTQFSNATTRGELILDGRLHTFDAWNRKGKEGETV